MTKIVEISEFGGPSVLKITKKNLEKIKEGHLARLHRGPLTCWSEIFLSKHPKLQHGLQKHPSERHALEKSQSKRPWGSSAATVLRAQSRAAGALQGAARATARQSPNRGTRQPRRARNRRRDAKPPARSPPRRPSAKHACLVATSPSHE